MDLLLFSQYLLSGIVIGIIYSLMALGITFIYGIMKMINWSMGDSTDWQLRPVRPPRLRARLGSMVPRAAARHGLGLRARRDRPTLSAAPDVPGRHRAPRRVRDHHHHRAHGPVPEPRDRPRRTQPVLAQGLRAPDDSADAAHLRQSHGGARGHAGAPRPLLRPHEADLARSRLRGAAQNRVGIQTAGVNVLRLDMLAFGVGVALAAAAGALLAPDFLVYPENGAISTFKGFEIIVIGGLGSIMGSVVGGLLLGVIEALGSVFLSPRTRTSTASCC